VTGSLDKTARLWLLQMKDLLDLARTTVGRNFFADEWQLYFPGEFCALFFIIGLSPPTRFNPCNLVAIVGTVALRAQPARICCLQGRQT
jgi:hypothetical protein